MSELSRRQVAASMAGFTLVEVLITIFVVGIGLLTVAGLQAAAKKANFEAIQRSTATALAQDLIERMRANPGNWSSYVGTVDPATLTTAADCTSTSTTCTVAQSIAYDLYQWGKKLAGSEETIGTAVTGGLVNPVGCVEDLASGIYRITIAWRGYSGIDQATAASTCGSSSGYYNDSTNPSANYDLRRQLYIEFQ